ncbi:transmembrane protein 45B-like [Osmia bicornis bicornis]|uniref:transmembrane protein 45B-like n=1 Tax=Osmia bicornis bicornis TaxID=1437191 RepID=UPI0010F68316|nr:transmembrane protein 45B-like [Osmia bicornis bicornis]XP_029049260.1 transmembrane protein 45B-like [Osmia bicornis bicornis]
MTEFPMYSADSCLPYILTGCIFYGFGLKWCYEYAKYWVSLRSRDDSSTTKGLRLIEKCEKLLNRHPIEGSLKLIATAVGLAGTITGGMQQVGNVSPKVVLATIYLFFAFSGLVDVLNFYFPHNVSEGLVKLALGQSFFIEGFLFLWGSVGSNAIVNLILAFIVWTTSLAIALELVWPELKLLRASTTLLHGGWIAHMVRVYHTGIPVRPEGVALIFSWHVAAASAVTLCVVAVTRSCAPRIILGEPPEIPIYDYCQEPDQRM